MIICLWKKSNVLREKYQAIKEQMPEADDETIAILLAVMVCQRLNREIEFDDKEKKLDAFRRRLWNDKDKSSK